METRNAVLFHSRCLAPLCNNLLRTDGAVYLSTDGAIYLSVFEQPQRDAWLTQIGELKPELTGLSGTIHLEFAIPRMGRRVDAVFLCGPAVFVIEYKVGSDQYFSHAIEQVTDYGPRFSER